MILLWCPLGMIYSMRMQEYSTEEAQVRFDELIRSVERGGSFIIRRGDDRVRVEPIPETTEADTEL